MDAIELFNSNGKSTGFFMCGKCRMVTLNHLWTFSSNDQPKNTREAAELCCTVPKCETCQKEFWPHGWREKLECTDCASERRGREQAEQSRVVLEQAADVTESYDGGWVWCEGVNSNDGFFSTLAELVEHLSWGGEGDEARVLPEWAYLCTTETRSVDFKAAMERRLEDICEDGYEDMDVEPDAKLLEAIEEFEKRHSSELTIYCADMTRKVKIPEIPKMEAVVMDEDFPITPSVDTATHEWQTETQ